MIESAVVAPSAPPRRRWRVLDWMRSAAKWLTILYTIVLIVLLPTLEWWGERNWLLSLLLYAPPQVLLAPLLILTPFCLVFRARWLLLHFICVALVCFIFMTHRSTSKPSHDTRSLTVITHNVGQGNREQFSSFAKKYPPDLVALQDVRGEGAQYARLFPGMQTATRGEFHLISRHRIRTSALVTKPQWRNRSVAARFEVEHNGRVFALYNVHLPTPRSQFNRFLSKRVVRDFFGDEDHAGGFASYRSWIDARRTLAQDLAAVFASENLPYIACGDFNTPDHGFIYHLFTNRMTDAHAEAGHGFGMTFPCDVKTVPASFSPWLRIDYAFAGPGWTPVYCESDDGRRSQHRAVMAQFLPESAR